MSKQESKKLPDFRAVIVGAMEELARQNKPVYASTIMQLTGFSRGTVLKYLHILTAEGKCKLQQVGTGLVAYDLNLQSSADTMPHGATPSAN